MLTFVKPTFSSHWHKTLPLATCDRFQQTPSQILWPCVHWVFVCSFLEQHCNLNVSPVLMEICAIPCSFPQDSDCICSNFSEGSVLMQNHSCNSDVTQRVIFNDTGKFGICNFKPSWFVLILPPPTPTLAFSYPFSDFSFLWTMFWIWTKNIQE